MGLIRSEEYRQKEGVYGETFVSKLTPIMQASAHYNYIPEKLETFTATGGSASASNEEFVCTTGTSIGGYGVIRTKRAVVYKPGQGVLARWACRFTTGVANSLQFGGLFTSTDGFYIGYDGSDFSCIHEYGGALEARTLTLSAGASGTESLTIVVNNDSHTFNVSSGSATLNANEIATELNANITGWSFTQNGSTVVGYSESTGAKSNTYSFTNNTGGGTCAGSWTQVTAGATTTRDKIVQADWNGLSLGTDIDPTKGNVYEIDYQYLGYGAIRFFIEDQSTGKFVNVHTIKYTNNNTTTSVSNPAFKIGITAASLGSTTDLTVACSSMGCFIEGEELVTEPPRAESNTKNLTTTLTSIITLRNRRLFNGKANQGEVKLKRIGISNDSTSKSAIFEIWANSTLGGTTNYSFKDESNSIIEIDTSGTTLTGGRFIDAIPVGPAGSETIDIEKLNEEILPTETLTIAGKTVSGTTDLTATVTWQEDI